MQYLFSTTLSYYQHTNSCLYSTVHSRSITMWNSRAFLGRIFFPCGITIFSQGIEGSQKRFFPVRAWLCVCVFFPFLHVGSNKSRKSFWPTLTRTRYWQTFQLFVLPWCSISKWEIPYPSCELFFHSVADAPSIAYASRQYPEWRQY